MKHYHRAWRSRIATFGTYTCCGGSVATGPEQQSVETTVSVGRHGAFCLHRGGRSAIADRSCAVLLNPGDVYRTSHPDRCDDDGLWFTFDRAAVVEVLARHDARVAHDPGHPFRDVTLPMSPRATLLAAALLRDSEPPSDTHAAPGLLLGGAPVDASAASSPQVEPACGARLVEELERDERALEWLDALVASAPVPAAARPPRGEPTRAHRDLAHAARRLLALRYAESLGVEDLATWLQVSPFHLCRVFRSVTGSTLHGVLEQHRLTAALDAVRDPRRDLSRIAFECGFSSHSHFTARFRRAYGMTPSHFRRRG